MPDCHLEEMTGEAKHFNMDTETPRNQIAEKEFLPQNE